MGCQLFSPAQRAIVDQQATLYHAQPYGHRDGLRQLILPEFDVACVHDQKTAMLAQ